MTSPSSGGLSALIVDESPPRYPLDAAFEPFDLAQIPPLGLHELTPTDQTNAAVKSPANHGKRATLWSAAYWLHAWSDLKSVALCRKSCIMDQANLGITHDGRASISGLKTCKSVWACPTCSLQVWNARKELLHQHLEAADDQGLSVSLTTLTMRHSLKHSLKALWKALQPAWNAVNSDRLISDLRTDAQHVGFIKRLEVTYSFKFGWHVHLHVLDFWQKPLTDKFVKEYEEAMFAPYERKLVRSGLPALKPGVAVVMQKLELGSAAESIASYLTALATEKVALELSSSVGAKQARMGNITPFGILDLAMADLSHLPLWHEWEHGSKGKKALQYSQSLLDYLKVKEVDDEELNEVEERNRSSLIIFDNPTWRYAVENLDIDELLTVTEDAFKSAPTETALMDRLWLAQMRASNYLASHGLLNGWKALDLEIYAFLC
jgi:hypothetical protein